MRNIPNSLWICSFNWLNYCWFLLFIISFFTVFIYMWRLTDLGDIIWRNFINNFLFLFCYIILMVFNFVFFKWYFLAMYCFYDWNNNIFNFSWCLILRFFWHIKPFLNNCKYLSISMSFHLLVNPFHLLLILPLNWFEINFYFF